MSRFVTVLIDMALEHKMYIMHLLGVFVFTVSSSLTLGCYFSCVCYTKGINCLIYIYFTTPQTVTHSQVTREKRKHGGGYVITGSVPVKSIPCLRG